jgi:tetratricopeptide (TPR) repeat protein
MDIEVPESNDEKIQQAEAFKDLGNQYFRKQAYIPAIENYTKAIGLNPPNSIRLLQSGSYILWQQSRLLSSN